jgi:hypothetical protein
LRELTRRTGQPTLILLRNNSGDDFDVVCDASSTELAPGRRAHRVMRAPIQFRPARQRRHR